MIVAVEIDETTGKADAVEVWSAMDVGKAINPGSVEGQIEGGFVQGMGFALTEEMVFDGPRLVNPSMMDYQGADIARCALRYPFDHRRGRRARRAVRRQGDRRDRLVPVPAAIANAVAAATGARLRRLPLTPERVLDGLLEGGDEN